MLNIWLRKIHWPLFHGSLRHKNCIIFRHSNSASSTSIVFSFYFCADVTEKQWNLFWNKLFLVNNASWISLSVKYLKNRCFWTRFFVKMFCSSTCYILVELILSLYWVVCNEIQGALDAFWLNHVYFSLLSKLFSHFSSLRNVSYIILILLILLRAFF